MKTEFKAGDKVIGWDSKKPKQKIETFFLSQLEGVTPGFVCTAVGVTKEQVEKGQVTLRRFEFIEKAPVDVVPPKFKIGQKVKLDKGSYTEFSVVTKIYTMTEDSSIPGLHYYSVQGMDEADIEEDDMSVPTDSELGAYFAC